MYKLKKENKKYLNFFLNNLKNTVYYEHYGFKIFECKDYRIEVYSYSKDWRNRQYKFYKNNILILEEESNSLTLSDLNYIFFEIYKRKRKEIHDYKHYFITFNENLETLLLRLKQYSLRNHSYKLDNLKNIESFIKASKKQLERSERELYWINIFANKLDQKEAINGIFKELICSLILRSFQINQNNRIYLNYLKEVNKIVN